MKKAFLYGLAASFFFSFTFILNRQMNLQGGHWIWSGVLRYAFMLPMLFVLLLPKKEAAPVWQDIKKRPLPWMLWSTVGFGLFYAPMCFASVYSPSWLVAAAWQITLVAGALLSPLFYMVEQGPQGPVKKRQKIPGKALFFSSFVLLGIIIIPLTTEAHGGTTLLGGLLAILPVVVGAFAYPLGNRKMMAVCDNRFNTLQRVFGMTLCSMPFWALLSVVGFVQAGPPNGNQLFQSLLVAVFSGIAATLLFFKATDMVSRDIHKLAVVESTQAGEILFTLLGGVLLFKDQPPSLPAFIGITLVMGGMILNSCSAR